MVATYRLNTSELTVGFIKLLKKLYDGKSVSITVEDEMDETEYLLSSPANRKMLEESINSEEGYEFSLEEFKKFSRELRNGKQKDFSGAKKVKIPIGIIINS